MEKWNKIIALYSVQLLLVVGRIGFQCGWFVVFAVVAEKCEISLFPL